MAFLLQREPDSLEDELNSRREDIARRERELDAEKVKVKFLDVLLSAFRTFPEAHLSSMAPVRTRAFKEYVIDNHRQKRMEMLDVVGVQLCSNLSSAKTFYNLDPLSSDWFIAKVQQSSKLLQPNAVIDRLLRTKAKGASHHFAPLYLGIKTRMNRAAMDNESQRPDSVSSTALEPDTETHVHHVGGDGSDNIRPSGTRPIHLGHKRRLEDAASPALDDNIGTSDYEGYLPAQTTDGSAWSGSEGLQKRPRGHVAASGQTPWASSEHNSSLPRADTCRSPRISVPDGSERDSLEGPEPCGERTQGSWQCFAHSHGQTADLIDPGHACQQLPPIMPVQQPSAGVPVPSTDGLVKYQPVQAAKLHVTCRDFYIKSICPGRTILRDDIYLREVCQISEKDKATSFLLLGLSASYYKEYLPGGSEEKSAVERFESKTIREGCRTIQPPARDAAAMLFIHHAILNPASHTKHWTDYLYPLKHVPGQQSNVVIAAHSVWLMAFLPLNNKYPFQRFDYCWLGKGDALELERVNSILGLPRKMLYLQYLIREQAKSGNYDTHLINKIRNCEISWHPEDLAQRDMFVVAESTSRAYRLATELYAHARVHRLLPSHEIVAATTEKLVTELRQLPMSGKGYSGIHPAFCFLIACACTVKEESFNELRGILTFIARRNKSNVSDLVKLVDWMWSWKISKAVLEEDWWEQLTAHLDAMMGNRPMCVT